MKKNIREFCRRGLVACGFGPLILAGVYWILQQQGLIHSLTVNEVCLGIISLTVLAFIAGGMNFLYQIEQLPLMVAILIHGGVLYTAYLATYLLNGWLEWGGVPLVAFTGIFGVGYLLIWGIIYSVTKKKTDLLNAALKQKQQMKS